MSVSASESDDNSTVTIKVAGRFDFSCHQEFSGAYRTYPKGEKQFIVDLAATEYMDSSSMGMLLQLKEYSDQSKQVLLINGNDGVRDILRIANFDKLFDIS